MPTGTIFCLELKKHQNYTKRLGRRTRKSFYEGLDPKSITDSKKFWRTISPLFTDKGGIRDKIVLVENEEIISDDGQVAETFNDFFSRSVEALGITENQLLLNRVDESEVGVDACIKEYETHPSIISIKKHVDIETEFIFHPVTTEDMEKKIASLDSKKNGGCIPTKFLKQFGHIVGKPMAIIWNTECVINKTFAGRLKLSDITPIFKALENSNKTNYRPISVLAIISKVFEKIMDEQTEAYIDKYLSKYLCGYRKGGEYGCENALVPMIENMKMARDKGQYAGAVLMDLSKAFDTINHKLLIAKLHAYGFSKNALELIYNYLSDRWHRTKVNASYSTWSRIMSGMPQGSVNGPKYFNIYLNDLFYLLTDTKACNIADDTTPYACNSDIGTLLRNLESDVASAVDWFDANYMKLNQSKCHFIIATHSAELFWIKVGDQVIWESPRERLLGIEIDKGLNFQKHVQTLCKVAGGKVTALNRLINIVPMERKKILMNSFIESQFSYCPLVWMFCYSRRLNNKIDNIHERGLRMVYRDYVSSFDELLRKNKSVRIHHRNIQLVAVAMFKVKFGLCSLMMKDLFEFNLSHDNSTFKIPKTKGEYIGKMSLRYFGPVVWEIMLPNLLRKLLTL